MRLLEIREKNAEGGFSSVASAELYPGTSPRQISLADASALAEARKMQGLCVKKYGADLITEGVDYSRLPSGSRLTVDGAELELSSEKKRCFDECVLRQRGETCTLPRGCAFARVLSGGRIEVGAPIFVCGEPEK